MQVLEHANWDPVHISVKNRRGKIPWAAVLPCPTFPGSGTKAGRDGSARRHSRRGRPVSVPHF